jgi:phosphoglycolate phosphatase-like HAD superfamily hydrolase
MSKTPKGSAGLLMYRRAVGRIEVFLVHPGTLLQSNWLHAAAWKDAFAQIDIDVPLEDVRRQIGKGGDELIAVFVPWWKRKAVEQPLKRYREFIFKDQYLCQVKPFPKVRELLQHMKGSRHQDFSRFFRTSRRIGGLQENCQH